MKAKLYLALFCVAFFWGTTFLAIRIGVETIPPFILAGIRNLISGFIIFLYLLSQKKLERINPRQFLRAFILSILMIVLANGLTTYAEKFITSGLASLISTFTPFCVLILNLIFAYEKLSVKTIVGILFGMSGIFLIYQSSLSDLLIPEYRQGIFALLLAILAWSIGTIFMKRASENSLTMLMNVCIQMLIAGVVLTSIQFYVTPDISPLTWSTQSIFAMIYLALFGSVVGYVAFSYLITQLPSTKVVVLSYVNLVVALFLGWLILDEIITSRIIIATILIISGVVIVNYKKAK
ncbi:EamA family transporter [Flavobacterium paronense]|uniref:DMT family transporter n=1 Tax=Flavobacterium paronense TaxID=1392775 RepID=A0ABV5GD50_9FLAO|nr:EamA family transporter [Flavobacterium paronense]MDN3676145.1 EamA family transporter [Flavobacterium paronense]